MIYLLLVTALAGTFAACVANWRFVLVVCFVLLIAQGVYAFVHSDLWNFVRTFVAIVAFQFGYLLSGIAAETWRARSLDKVKGAGQSVRSPKSSD